MAESPGFHFITAVWGEQYTQLYCQIVLPTQLSAGNLAVFGNDSADEYWIYTTRADAQAIERAPAYATVKRMIRVRFAWIDDIVDPDVPKHDLLFLCHQRSIRQAQADRAAMVFLSPDAIWADGTFASVRKLAERGLRAVMTAGIRVRKETFVPAFEKTFLPEDGGIINVPPRDAVRLSVAHLHNISATLLWDGAMMNSCPSHLYWRVADQGLLARCYHLHPLMVWPVSDDASFTASIDTDLVQRACTDTSQIHVVTDSDQILAIEISDDSMNVQAAWPKKKRTRRVAVWVLYQTNQLHREFAKNCIMIHADEVGDRWTEARKASDNVLAEIDSWLRVSWYLHLRRAVSLARNALIRVFSKAVACLNFVRHRVTRQP